MNEFINNMTFAFHNSFMNTIMNVLNAIIFLMIGLLACKIIKKLVLKILNKSNLEQSVISFISSVMNILCMLLIGVVILSILKFPISAITAIFSTITLGLGIAFKESLANLGSGVILLLSKQFKIGDYISSNGVEGTVYDLNVFTTSLTTIDNKLIMIPNSKLMSDSIINFTNQRMRRVDIRVTVPYRTDLPKLKEILKNIIESDKRILDEPEYIIGVRDFSERGMVVVIAPWVLTEDYWPVYYDLMENIVTDLNNNGIRIPYNQIMLIKDKKHSY